MFKRLILALCFVPILSGSPAWAQITLDNSGAAYCSHDNGSGSSKTASCTVSSVTAADLIVCEIAFYNAGSNAFSKVSDTVNSGNYSTAVAAHENASAGEWVGIYYMQNSGSGSVPVTLTTTVSEPYAAISCQAWKGAATSSALDSPFVQQQNGTTANPTTGSTQTPAGNGEVVISALVEATQENPTAGTNYTRIAANNSSLLFAEYWIQTTATATNAPWTQTAVAWTDQMAAFKAASSSHAYTATPSESNVASDAISRQATFGRADSETNAASAALARQVSFGRGDTESNTASDLISRLGVFRRSDAESNTASDAISRLAGFGRGDSETNSTADSLARLASFGRGDG